MNFEKKSFIERLQAWEDRNPEIVWLVIGTTILIGFVAIMSAGHDNGWRLIGQSLKETFWRW